MQSIKEEKAKLIIVGAFPIWRRPNLSSNSLAERSYKRNRGRDEARRGEYSEAARAFAEAVIRSVELTSTLPDDLWQMLHQLAHVGEGGARAVPATMTRCPHG